MKLFLRFCFVLFLILEININTKCQSRIKNKDVDGLYISAGDYKSNRLYYQSDRFNKNSKIRLGLTFFNRNIVYSAKGEKLVFNKDSIFAVKLKNGDSYRFINKEFCKIVDSSYLFIYEYKYNHTGFIRNGNKIKSKTISLTNYFFSANDHKRLYKLSLENLQHVNFGRNGINQDIFKIFSGNDKLCEIDTHTGHFVINDLIASSLRMSGIKTL